MSEHIEVALQNISRERERAVRLTADAVLAAADRCADAWENLHEHTVEGRLLYAVLAHRKAKAEQAKERAT